MQNIDLEKIGKFLQTNVENLYFNCVFTCKYGSNYVGVAGTERRFIMWRSIIIWETGILEINPISPVGSIEEEAIKEIFNLLDVKFIHLGSNEFDEVKEYYKIIDIKEVKRLEKLLEEIKEVEIIKTAKQVAKDNIRQQIVLINLFEQDEVLIDEYERLFGLNLNCMTEEEINCIDLTTLSDAWF